MYLPSSEKNTFSVFDVNTNCLPLLYISWQSSHLSAISTCIDESLKIKAESGRLQDSTLWSVDIHEYCSSNSLWSMRWTGMKSLLIRDNVIFFIQCRKRQRQIQKATHRSRHKKLHYHFSIMTLHFWWDDERVMTSIWCSMQTQQAQELIRSMYISIILYYG